MQRQVVDLGLSLSDVDSMNTNGITMTMPPRNSSVQATMLAGRRCGGRRSSAAAHQRPSGSAAARAKSRAGSANSTTVCAAAYPISNGLERRLDRSSAPAAWSRSSGPPWIVGHHVVDLVEDAQEADRARRPPGTRSSGLQQRQRDLEQHRHAPAPSIARRLVVGARDGLAGRPGRS